MLRARLRRHAIVVGSVRDLALHPRSLTAGYLRVYRLVGTAGAAGSASLELLHETPTEDVPYALAPFHGRLLAGVGRTLRLYELGKKRLLRRCEARNLPVLVQSVHVLSAERVVVGDLAHSFHWLRYRPDENSLATFADGTTPRWLTAACALDVGTVAGADKFGNVLVSRLGEDAEAETVDVGSAADGYLGGAPVKARARARARFHTRERKESWGGEWRVGGSWHQHNPRDPAVRLLAAVDSTHVTTLCKSRRRARPTAARRGTSWHARAAHPAPGAAVCPRLPAQPRPPMRPRARAWWRRKRARRARCAEELTRGAGAALDQAEEIVQYHVGELVVSLQKQRLSAASHECVLFATNMGGIGALLPVRSRDDIDFLKHLEMHMRQEAPPLCGRDHMFFRSAFFPVKVRARARASRRAAVCPRRVPSLTGRAACSRQRRAGRDGRRPVRAVCVAADDRAALDRARAGPHAERSAQKAGRSAQQRPLRD